MSRIKARFDALKAQGRKGLVTFMTAGDPDYDTAEKILNSLPASGADFIEIGMPFSDPMADGPAIQLSSRRALDAGMTMDQTLSLAASLRVTDTKTPLILMGYYNPIYIYGTSRFVEKARESGADGLIIVDLPPEEDEALRIEASKAQIDIIRLVTPTTTPDRLEVILDGASGFLYYVAVTGVTGTSSADPAILATALDDLRARTSLPVAVGFGIRTPQNVAAMKPLADAVVVGSALVETIGRIKNGDAAIGDVTSQVRALADALAA